MSQVPPTQPLGLLDQPPERTSGVAIAALVVGIIGLISFCAPVGLVALILGIVAIGQIGNAGNRLVGRGMAVAGIVLGSLAMMVGVVALLIGILLPALGAARRTARQMQNNTQLRGIHQSFVMYAQGNQSNFPGLTGRNADTVVTDGSVEGRLQILLDNNYFTAEYLVSPSETLTPWQPGTKLTPSNYSYALLDITQRGGRQKEWTETLNTEAVTLTDRNAGTAGDVFSVHTQSGDGWRGGVAYNDNHVVFESTHVVATKYDRGAPNVADDLFTPAGLDDAWMVHSIGGGPTRSALEPSP